VVGGNREASREKERSSILVVVVVLRHRRISREGSFGWHRRNRDLVAQWVLLLLLYLLYAQWQQ